MNERLFSQYDIWSVIEGQKQQIKKEVNKLESNYLLNVSEEDLVNSLCEKLRLNIPQIIDSGSVVSSSETKIDVRRSPESFFFDSEYDTPYFIDGTKTIIAFTFEGDADFFKVKPNTFSGSNPSGNVTGNEIRVIFEQTQTDGNVLEAQVEKTLLDIKQRLAWLENDAREFNATLENSVRQQISERKKRLLANSNMISELGLPIRQRDNTPTTYSVPVNRHKPKIEMPKATSKPFQLEPVLDFGEYENILSIMKNMVLVMEKSPKAFDKMGEEDLRTHFLVQLNGQYEGQATGETFNYQGKTDIIINEKGKDVFIAECKFWKGESVFLETIDQLLSYLSWRDTKTAILIFNRNKNFTGVLSIIEQTVPKHNCFKRFVKKIDETSFQYIFHQPEDINREMIVTVMAFNVPSKSK